MEDEQLPAGPDVWMPVLSPPDVETLTSEESVSLQNLLVLIRDILTTAIQDMGDTVNIASVYEPFQALIRQTLLAGRQFYADHDVDNMVSIVNALLDSGKLDSASVARAPTPLDVLVLIRGEDARRLLTTELDSNIEAVIASNLRMQVGIIADAMDCVYKQAIGAPQTQGSMFARPEAS